MTGTRRLRYVTVDTQRKNDDFMTRTRRLRYVAVNMRREMMMS